MKHIKLINLVLFAIASFALASCGEDAPAAPDITLIEVGHENSFTAVAGDDMHLEADIVAEGVIQAIYVELHQEEGDYEIENEWTEGKYIGVCNTEFHEHIDIPAEAPVGEYHLHFTVTDREGQQSQAVANVNILQEEVECNK